MGAFALIRDQWRYLLRWRAFYSVRSFGRVPDIIPERKGCREKTGKLWSGEARHPEAQAVACLFSISMLVGLVQCFIIAVGTKVVYHYD